MRFAVLAVVALGLSGCSLDHLFDNACPSGTPSAACDVVVDSLDECPSLDSLCSDTCGASFECCYCHDGEYEIEYSDCAPCPDADYPDAYEGYPDAQPWPDAAPPPDAAVSSPAP